MFRAPLRAIICLASLTAVSLAQEVALNLFPVRMQEPLSVPAMYRLFFRHLAAFERQARVAESHGASGDAFRNHFKNQFGFTPNEYSLVAHIALRFENQLTRLDAQQRSLAVALRQKELSGSSLRIESLPTLPSRSQRIQSEIDALTKRSRNQLKAALPAARFARLETNLKSRDRFYREFPQTSKREAQPGESAAFTYGYTSINFDPATSQVTAYAHTEMDGTLLP